MRLALLSAVLAWSLFAARPDAGAPAARPDAASPRVESASEDEQLVKDLDLLESLDVLERLDQLDVDTGK